MKKIALFLVLTTSIFAAYEEGVSYPYPFEESDPYFDSIEKKAEKKMEAEPAWQGKIGKADVTVDVIEDNEANRTQREWNQKKREEKPNKKRRAKDDEKEKKDDDLAPGVKFTVKWGGK